MATIQELTDAASALVAASLTNANEINRAVPIIQNANPAALDPIRDSLIATAGNISAATQALTAALPPQ